MADAQEAVPVDNTRVQAHTPRKREKYRTPGPGTYEPENAAASLKFSKHGGSSFGGPHATTDRFAPQPDEKEKALTPGPGTYAGTSALGKQALSKQRTAQASRFGSSGRESAAKQYFAGMMEAPAVSQVAAQPDDVTPGPGQYSVAASSAFTPTGVAGRTNAASPSPSFGGNLARVDRSTTGALAHTAKAADLPGPGSYEPATMIGKVAPSTKRSNTQPGFAKSPRFKKGIVAPGMDAEKPPSELTPAFKYASPVSAVGRQTLSRTPSQPSYTMGGRSSAEVVVNKNGSMMTKSSRAPAVPGPGAYMPITSPIRAVTADSRKENHPQYSFSKSTRDGPSPVRSKSPGPGAYSSLSSVGQQSLSARRSMPSSSFGKAKREQVEITVAPGTPFKTRTASPGPGTYKAAAAVGRQVVSSKRTGSSYRFSGASRSSTRTYTSAAFTEGTGDPNLGAGTAHNPGPGKYSPPSAILGGDPRRRHGPKYSFGSKNLPRQIGHRPTTSPQVGPGSYQANRGVGKQTVSTKASAPSYGFSRSAREQVEKTVAPGTPFVSATATPGPGAYRSASSMGKQTLSTRANRGGNKFSRSGRPNIGGKKKKTPGPGRYGAKSSLGRQASSRKRTSPGFRFGSSTRPGLEVAVG